MIKFGDKVILDGVEYVIKEIKGNDVLLVKRDNALNVVFVNEKTLYAKLYEQQKQRADELEDVIKRYHDEALREIKRADELEKRWSELVDVLKKKYEYYKIRADDESFGSIEQGKWKIAKHELMMVLKIMTDLKRGETE